MYSGSNFSDSTGGNHSGAEVQIDRQAALEALSGSEELLADLGQMFVEDAPKVIERVEQGVRADDSRQVRRELHSLKGMIATFFAEVPFNLVRDLEQDASQGELRRLNGSGLPRLKQTISQLCERLEAEGLADGN